MDNFVYTESVFPVMSAGRESTALRALWYNENTRELIVVTNNDFPYNPAYRYEGVSPFVWATFKASQSKGNYYATEIKPNYGPGERALAEDVMVEREEVSKSSGKVSVGTPKGLTYADDAIVDGKLVDESTNLVVNPSFEEVPDNVESGYFGLRPVTDLDPDDEFLEEFDEDAVEDTEYFDLGVRSTDVNEAVNRYLYEVSFIDSENPDKVMVRKVEADSVDEALEDVFEVAEMLDRVFIAVKVEVNFE